MLSFRVSRLSFGVIVCRQVEGAYVFLNDYFAKLNACNDQLAVKDRHLVRLKAVPATHHEDFLNKDRALLGTLGTVLRTLGLALTGSEVELIVVLFIVFF